MKPSEDYIAKDSLKAYLHWHGLLTDIMKMPFEEIGHGPSFESMKKRYRFSDEWLSNVQWETEREMWRKLPDSKKDALLHPFRKVQIFMRWGAKTKRVYRPFTSMDYQVRIRDYSKRREGAEARTEWPLNVLLYALVCDFHIHKVSKFTNTAATLSKLGIDDGDKEFISTYDTVRKRFQRIDGKEILRLLKFLSEGCTQAKKEFIPTDVSIPEWPLDFLAYIAHHTKYKRNPRLSIVSISKTDASENRT